MRLYGLAASRHVDALTDALDEFLLTGTDAAAATFWKSFVRLNKLAEGLPPEQAHQVALELVWRMQAVLARETDAARIARARRTVKESSRLTSASKAVAKGAKGAGIAAALLPDPNALMAVGKMKGVIRRTNRALWAVWKRFDQVVAPNHPGVVQALRRITENVDKIRELLKKRAFVKLDRQHLWSVRGLLGEAYSLMSKVWLKEKDKLLREAEELASKRGVDWTARYLTQLDHAVRIGGREGPDGVVVLINEKTGEVVIHAVVQVKIEKVISAFKQLYRDMRRFMGEEGVTGAEAFASFEFRLASGAPSAPYTIVGGTGLPKMYVLSAADSVAVASDLDFLKSSAGAAITELKLDMTVNQLSRLAIGYIEAMLKYL